MNRAEIQNQIIAFSHRSDLTDSVGQFIDNTTQRLNRRLGITLDPMLDNNGTNIIAEVNSSIYLYGGLREMAIFTADRPSAEAYEQLFNIEVDNLNINYNGTEWDNEPLAVLSEDEVLTNAT